MIIAFYSDHASAVALALASIAAGFALAVGGYRSRRTGMFTSALLSIGNVVISVLSTFNDRFYSEPSWYYSTYVAAGLVCGGIALLHTKTGIGLTGFGAVVVLALLIVSIVASLIKSIVFSIAMFIGDAISAVLTLWLKKPAFIVTTSFVGTNALEMDGVAYFWYRSIVNTYGVALADMTTQELRNVGIDNHYNRTYKLNSAWWILFVITLVLTLIATAAQLRLIARDMDHDRIDASTISTIVALRNSGKCRRHSGTPIVLTILSRLSSVWQIAQQCFHQFI